MTTMGLEREKRTECRVKWVGARPISFEEFLEIDFESDWMELIDGVAVEKTMVQLEHEKLQGFLYHLMAMHTEEGEGGVVLGSRTPVKITRFRGRMPDLLFVRKERLDIVEEKGIFGPPDLVIEIASPNDWTSDFIALETDYRSIGIPEIVFVHQKTRSVRVLRKRGEDDIEEILTEGRLNFEAIAGFWVELGWLFEEPRPTIREALGRIRS